MRTLSYITNHTRTGGGLCYGLRTDMFPGRTIAEGASRFRADIGCLDAPLALPGGATKVEDSATFRHILQHFIPRD